MMAARIALLAEAIAALDKLRNPYVTDADFTTANARIREILIALAGDFDGGELRETLREVLALVDGRAYMTPERQEVLRRAREVER